LDDELVTALKDGGLNLGEPPITVSVKMTPSHEATTVGNHPKSHCPTQSLGDL
jgi:hypothetical protein